MWTILIEFLKSVDWRMNKSLKHVLVLSLLGAMDAWLGFIINMLLHTRQWGHTLLSVFLFILPQTFSTNMSSSGELKIFYPCRREIHITNDLNLTTHELSRVYLDLNQMGFDNYKAGVVVSTWILIKFSPKCHVLRKKICFKIVERALNMRPKEALIKVNYFYKNCGRRIKKIELRL